MEDKVRYTCSVLLIHPIWRHLRMHITQLSDGNYHYGYQQSKSHSGLSQGHRSTVSDPGHLDSCVLYQCGSSEHFQTWHHSHSGHSGLSQGPLWLLSDPGDNLSCIKFNPSSKWIGWLIRWLVKFPPSLTKIENTMWGSWRGNLSRNKSMYAPSDPCQSCLREIQDFEILTFS